MGFLLLFAARPTLAQTPFATTLAATLVTSNGATLNGSFNPNGSQAYGWFDWGTDTNYGNSTTHFDLGNGNTLITNSLPLLGLPSGVIYHFRASVSNTTTVVYGTNNTFRTSPGYFTVTTLADSGADSLRQIISNSFTGDFISFAANGTLALTNGVLLITNNLTITGPGTTNLTISASNLNRIFYISSNATVSISGLVISDGRATNAPPGNASQVYGASGGNGGAIYNAGALTLRECIIQGSSAGDGGTSYSTGYPSGPGGSGGGVFNSGTLRMDSCTVSGNSAGQGGHGVGQAFPFEANVAGKGGSGGGICNYGSAVLNQCTLSMNGAGSGGDAYQSVSSSGIGGAGGDGGGIFSTGQLTITACTVANNIVGGPGYRSFEFGSGNAIAAGTNSPAPLVHSSIVASDQYYPGTDVSGAFSSQGHNLISKVDSSTGFTNGINGDLCGTTTAPLDPLLAALADNGGETMTMALHVNSPAFNAGDDSILDPPDSFSTDQRGFIRKSSTHVDIGAYEFDAAGISVPVVTTLAATWGPLSAGTAIAPATIYGAVIPGGAPTTAWFQFGLNSNYGDTTTTDQVGSDTNSVPVNLVAAVAAGYTYHFRCVASNAVGTAYGLEQTFRITSPLPVGDLNGDGIVDQTELDTVLSNYWPTSPWLQMTNVAGLGGTNVTFALTNSTAGAFSVEYSTNLADWQFLGSAISRYMFTDTNAPTDPLRYYRLRWP